jgi:hypothetical protein
MIDARSITKSLGGMWVGKYGLARCPAHDDRKPSLKISDDERKSDRIDLHCFAGCSWQTIKAELKRQGLIGRNPASNGRNHHARPVVANDPRRRVEFALDLWRQSTPLPDTLGWRYFTERRGLQFVCSLDFRMANKPMA